MITELIRFVHKETGRFSPPCLVYRIQLFKGVSSYDCSCGTDGITVTAVQTMLLLDHIRDIIRDDAALRAYLEAAATADTAVGNQISVLLFFCVAEGERRSLDWFLAEIKPLSAALI